MKPLAHVELESALKRSVRGEVRFDAGSRALYATDGSNYRQVPIGVVIPRDIEDIVATFAACRRFGAPITSRGGGTSLAGQTCNVAVVIDGSKHVNGLIDLDPRRRVARVRPGIVLDKLRHAANRHDLTFAPDPSTHAWCTLGGMIGNNSCGVHSVMAGKTAENVEALEVLTYDGARFTVGPTSEAELEAIVAAGGRRGEIYAGLRRIRDRYGDLIRARYPRQSDLPRRVSGYNLDQLLPEYGFHVARALVGTEGTCVAVLEATLRLVHWPRHRSLVVLGYPSIYEAADHVVEVLASQPQGLEALDDTLVSHMKKKGMHPGYASFLPEGKGWLCVEFGGATKDEADARARELMARLEGARGAPRMKLYDDERQEKKVWEVRESGLGATARVPGERDTWEGWEDSAVPPARLGEYLRGFRALLKRYDYSDGTALYGHFGQGCLHTRIPFDLTTERGVAKFRSFIDEAADLVLSLGGSMSGEHGDGQSRAAMLPKQFGPELMEAMREFKRLWDPQGKMNPGKVVDAYAPTENLRLGADYRPWSPGTHFHYPDDGGDFARVGTRCVGVGKCRKDEDGVMCPSYMATREEKHSTRGRAHLLFEMMQGDPLEASWRNEAVREALDLCLACKGCKAECPLNVDMATYKAEFLAHHYEGRLRPRQAYAFGLIHWWARLGSLAPRLVNFVMQREPLASIAKLAAGCAPERAIPRFAETTFKSWWRARGGTRNPDGAPVVLWVDTFGNHFHPAPLAAAVEVLEAAGFAVLVPMRALCCGRPLYDFGMLGLAKKLLRDILDDLRPAIRAGIPVVGLEPSCVAVFRDEMKNLMPHDEDATRLRSLCYVLGELLEEKCKTFLLRPRLDRKALVQAHCHHKAVLKFDADVEVLKRIGLDVEVLDAGCCGMAGSFGFEAGEKYQVSQQVGERRLLPAVRAAAEDTIVVADGFSCREQIEQGTGRKALHLAEVVKMALPREAGAIEKRGAFNTTTDESSKTRKVKSGRERSAFRAFVLSSSFVVKNSARMRTLGVALGGIGLFAAFALLSGRSARRRPRARRRTPMRRPSVGRGRFLRRALPSSASRLPSRLLARRV